MTPKRKEQLRKKLLEAKHRLQQSMPRFAGLLSKLEFLAVKPIYHMSTNGHCIWFDPDWLAKLDDKALDFMLCHQLMHIYLGHIDRSALYQGARFHLACDVIANSYLRKLGWEQEKLRGVGTIYHQTFYPVMEGCELTPEEAFAQIPLDPATLGQNAGRRYMIDSEVDWGRADNSGGEVILESENPQEYERHLQAETRRKITESEESPEDRVLVAIESIIRAREAEQKMRADAPDEKYDLANATGSWEQQMKETLKAVRSDRSHAEDRIRESMADERFWQKVNRTCLDWRQLLDTFLQEEVTDYTFLPPDRRFQDGDFFLPDFSDKTTRPVKILFMVDTSGSVEDELLSAAYTEIQSAIEQFHGKLTGLLGFFDMRVYGPIPFSSVEDIRKTRIYGGGGTDFSCIFSDCRTYMGEDALASIIILTDGQGTFPDEEACAGIPVLWLLTDDTVVPPWGRCAYLKST